MDDWLERIRDGDEQVRRDREQRQSEAAAKRAAKQEYGAAWDAVIRTCLAGDQAPQAIPDLSPFLTLAQVIVVRGWGEWLDEMGANLSADLNSWLQERRDQLFILGLIREGSKPKTNAEKLTTIYLARIEGQRSLNWRAEAASEIRDYFDTRIVEAENEAARQADELKRRQREEQIEQIRRAGRRGMIWRNLQFLRRSQKLAGSGNVNEVNAQVRDWWNETQLKRRIGCGRKGADTVRKGIAAAERFWARHCQGMPFGIDEIITVLQPDGSADSFPH